MNRPKKNSATKKMCPLLGEVCLGDGCMIYHEQFDRCEIGLMNLNLHTLKEAIKDLLLKLKPITV